MTKDLSTPSPGLADDQTLLTTSHAEMENLAADELGLPKDMPNNHSKEGSSFVTLYPYTPKKTQRNVPKKTKFYPQRLDDFNKMFGPERWTKFFEIKSEINDDFELYNILAKKSRLQR